MRSILVLVMCACGSPSERAPDAATPDAALDAPPTTVTAQRYVLSDLLLGDPSTNALDLDGDGVADNDLGSVVGLGIVADLGSQGPTDHAIDHGTLLMLSEIRTDSFIASTQLATFQLLGGSNPMPPACATGDVVCRKHLTGMASFTPLASPPYVLTGEVVAGVLRAGPGRLLVRLTLFGSDDVIALELVGARVEITLKTDGAIERGVIAGGILQGDIDTQLWPELDRNVQRVLARDCPTTTIPDCGCPAGSGGRTLIAAFDQQPRDCQITLFELQTDPNFPNLLRPDVILDGKPAASLGFGFEAVGASF